MEQNSTKNDNSFLFEDQKLLLKQIKTLKS